MDIVCCERPVWAGAYGIIIPSPLEAEIEFQNRAERKRLRYHPTGRVCRFFYAVLLLSSKLYSMVTLVPRTLA